MSLDECPHGKRLPAGSLDREEKPEAPAGSQEEEDHVHSAQSRQVYQVLLFILFFYLYNRFKDNQNDCKVSGLKKSTAYLHIMVHLLSSRNDRLKLQLQLRLPLSIVPLFLQGPAMFLLGLWVANYDVAPAYVHRNYSIPGSQLYFSMSPK